ncbi:MBOAT family O-acyltransferase [Sandarakinorhabdus rubra]|uniref:MBOAT family O-acyltransferase n=1 Tax=Sandarakinorhabdus rubra TaxID=2672568 RepID=UPI0013DBEC61|nr:MBOAT family protein [Sandarakinorhabdus rubra]
MLFPTLDFALFFLPVLVLVWTVGQASNEWRKIILLLASWIFYGAWDWRFVALLIASAAINWSLAQRVHARAEAGESVQPWLGLGVAANLAILGFFKYFGFFLAELAPILTAAGFGRDLPLIEIILPVGISFFTFQGMSYLIDIARRQTQPASFLDLTLLMSFFPHLVAGPIVRASHLVPQFAAVPRLTRTMVSASLILIVWGLFKKAVIASELATGLVDTAFRDPAALSGLDLLAGAYGYAVQIYCDFSAYSDMAVGIAGLMGYRFPRNFDQPYRAASLQDFWRRWHISLSSWLRDYLYISLGGNRGGVWFVCRNLMLTMLLGGFWHGAKWTFLIWGGLHGLVLAIERLWREWRPSAAPFLPRPLAILFIFHIVLAGWIFFRADTLAGALAYFAEMAAMRPGITLTTPLMAGLIGLGMAIHFAPPALLPVLARRVAAWPAPLTGIAVGLAILAIDTMRGDGIAAFIYYQF